MDSKSGFQNIEKQDQNIALLISSCTVTSNETEIYKVTFTTNQLVELLRNDENFG